MADRECAGMFEGSSRVLRRYGTRSAELVTHIHADRTRLIGYVANERRNDVDFVACNANQGMRV